MFQDPCPSTRSRTIVEDVVALSWEADAHLAIVSNTCTHWFPGEYSVSAVLNAAEYGGTHYEELAPLFENYDWGVVITIADYDSSVQREACDQGDQRHHRHRAGHQPGVSTHIPLRVCGSEGKGSQAFAHRFTVHPPDVVAGSTPPGQQGSGGFIRVSKEEICPKTRRTSRSTDVCPTRRSPHRRRTSAA